MWSLDYSFYSPEINRIYQLELVVGSCALVGTACARFHSRSSDSRDVEMRIVDVIVDKKFIDDLRKSIRRIDDSDDEGILFCKYIADRNYKVQVFWPPPTTPKFYIVDPEPENKDFFLFRDEFTVPPIVVKLPKELFEI